MYGFSKHKRISVGVASAASWSSYVNIMNANRVVLEIPEFNTLLGANQANVYVQGAATAAGTYYTVKTQGASTATTGNVIDWEVPLASGGYMAVCDPIVGFDFMRVKFGTAATDGYTCYAHIME